MTAPTLALLGAGSRGLTVYARYLEENPSQGRLVAVAEPRDYYREETARRHQIPPENVFQDWRQLLAGPKLADALIIATQDQEHRESALLAAERGYDILLEKPMDVTPEGCREIVAAVRRHRVVLVVAHVLRYTAYFQKMKEIVDSGALGQLATVRHFEPVNFWHQAHSFVRGNWRNSSTSAPMILTKSCHDLDLLLYLIGRPALYLSSFGARSHFRPEQRPEGTTERCLDCPLAEEGCPYSATAFYLGMSKRGEHVWPLDVLTSDMSEDGVTRALREGPYGRCVYACDNDVVDHQVVSLEFADQVSATFTMTAFTEGRWRETELLGSHGQLIGDGRHLRLVRFRNRICEQWDMFDPRTFDKHGGGDAGLMLHFLQALGDRSAALADDGPEQSLAGHLMAFAAEQARLTRTVVPLEQPHP